MVRGVNAWKKECWQKVQATFSGRFLKIVYVKFGIYMHYLVFCTELDMFTCVPVLEASLWAGVSSGHLVPPALRSAPLASEDGVDATTITPLECTTHCTTLLSSLTLFEATSYLPSVS